MDEDHSSNIWLASLPTMYIPWSLRGCSCPSAVSSHAPRLIHTPSTTSKSTTADRITTITENGRKGWSLTEGTTTNGCFLKSSKDLWHRTEHWATTNLWRTGSYSGGNPDKNRVTFIWFPCFSITLMSVESGWSVASSLQALIISEICFKAPVSFLKRVEPFGYIIDVIKLWDPEYNWRTWSHTQFAVVKIQELLWLGFIQFHNQDEIRVSSPRKVW